MFFIILVLEKNLMHDWMKKSIDLLKASKKDDPDASFIYRKKGHAELKQALVDSGRKPQIGAEKLKSDLRTIADLMKVNPPKAMDVFDHSY
jgi:hypothetical protein